MNRVAHRLSWSVVALAIVIAAGCGSDARSAAADDGHRRYHDGQRWIEVEVALDRFASDSTPVAQTGPSTEARRREVVTVTEPGAFVGDLDVSVQEYRRNHPGVTQVYACLYAPGAKRDQTLPMYLTHRLTLRGAPAQELVALAAKHGARVIEKVSYSPDTVICEATGPSLLAALDAANDLREEPGVIFATPLIERHFANRVGR